MIRHTALLTAAMLACGHPAHSQTQPDPAAAAAAQEIANEAARTCAAMDNGQMTYGDGVTQFIDVTGDDVPELILNESGFQCSTAASLFCGSAGCAVHVFVGPAQSSWFVRGMEVVEAFGSKVILFALHGTACGGYGVDMCVEAVVWTGDRFSSLAAADRPAQ